MSHYDLLDRNFAQFCERLELTPIRYAGLITAHGDKCYSYSSKWKKARIPFEHGVAIYLITYLRPWDIKVRNTVKGWIDVSQWIIDNYERFKPLFGGLEKCTI